MLQLMISIVLLSSMQLERVQGNEHTTYQFQYFQTLYSVESHHWDFFSIDNQQTPRNPMSQNT